jgi:N-methylhydantoinase A/oxoprolinase/acetone carboxylase beta subunit
VLGYLDPAFFLGGAMRLDRQRAARAIEGDIAGPLGLSQMRAAWGIHAVVNDNMARAAKVHCLERGKDPRDYVLVAYGGAGPVHAWQVAAALGIGRVLYPLRAGVMSALGFLVAPASFERMRSDPCALDDVDPARADAILGELEAESAELVQAAGVPLDACSVSREAALRYAGQSYALDVPLLAGRVSKQSLGALRAAFLDMYRSRYHRANANVPLELVSWRVRVSGPPPDVKVAPPGWDAGSGLKGRRPVFFPEAGDFIDCPVYDRLALRPGISLRGPAVIEEPESTAVIGPGGTVEVDGQGNLVAALPAVKSVGVRQELAL